MLKKNLNSFLFIIYSLFCLKIFIVTIHSVFLILVNYLQLPHVFFHYLYRINNDVLFDFLKMHLDFTVFSLFFILSFIIYQLKYYECNWKFNNWKDYVFILMFCLCIYEGIQTFNELFSSGYKLGDTLFVGTWKELEGSFFLSFVKTTTTCLFCLGFFLFLLVYKNLKYTIIQKSLIIAIFSVMVYIGSFVSYFALVGYPSAMSNCFELDPLNYNLDVLKNFQIMLLNDYSIIPTSFCHPEHVDPCFELKQKMNTALCQTSAFADQFYIPQRRVYPITEILKTVARDNCSLLRTEYYDCLDTMRRETWVKQYIKLHYTPQQYQIPTYQIVFPRPKI